MNDKYVIIDGLIGSGKTTIGPSLVQYFNKLGVDAVFIHEPVEEWKSSGKLKEFYDDIPGKAFEFHMYTLKTIFDNTVRVMNKNKHNTVFVCERSIFSVKYIFFENLKELGFITPRQEYEFNEKFKEYSLFLPTPSLFIWLDTPISTCMERIKKRNRENEESKITEEYQVSLWKKHEAFFELIKKEYDVIVSPQISLDYRTHQGSKSHEDNFLEYIYYTLNK